MMTGDAMLSECELIDTASVLAFYAAHVDGVYRYASRLTAGNEARTQDLVQEVFVTLATAVRSGCLTMASAGWLTTCTRNIFLRQLRHDGRELARVVRIATRRALPDIGPEQSVDDVWLRAAMQKLSDVERVALVLRYIDDLPVAEVAAALGRSSEATESLLARARRHLRVELKGDQP
jgi:RNA polymerase sigma-70 factor, ECF subfamily